MIAARIFAQRPSSVLPAVFVAAALGAAVIWAPTATDYLWPPALPDWEIQKTEAPPLSLRALATRPLFSETRRPVAAQTARVEAAPARLRLDAAFLLRGVVSGGDAEIVILERRDFGQSARLKTGDSLDGYRLASIEGSQIVFAKDSDRVVFARAAAGGQAQSPP